MSLYSSLIRDFQTNKNNKITARKPKIEKSLVI